MDPIEAIIAAAGMVATGGVGVYAGRHTRRSADAEQAVSGIEAERWHAELTPEFTVTASTNTNADLTILRIELTGPLALRGLDKIAVSIRDDRPGRRPHAAGPPSAEAIAAQVWGPYRFAPFADGADPNGRTIWPFALQVGERHDMPLMKTRAPYWTRQSDEQWWQQWAGEPVRLLLRCRRGDDPPWTVPLQVTARPS